MKPKQKQPITILNKLAKIEKLPQNVRDSIPFTGIMQNGIIETYPGTFTKSYKLPNISFSIASEEEQYNIYVIMQGLMNSFNEQTRWQFNIINHTTDKLQTLNSIRLEPKRDALNSFRSEVNKIMLSCMQTGTASITQDRYLTVSIDDISAEHAVSVLNKIDIEVNKQFRKLTPAGIRPMSTMERIILLYNIYNQHHFDYQL